MNTGLTRRIAQSRIGAGHVRRPADTHFNRTQPPELRGLPFHDDPRRTFKLEIVLDAALALSAAAALMISPGQQHVMSMYIKIPSFLIDEILELLDAQPAVAKNTGSAPSVIGELSSAKPSPEGRAVRSAKGGGLPARPRTHSGEQVRTAGFAVLIGEPG